jgi:hypothetical protein
LSKVSNYEDIMMAVWSVGDEDVCILSMFIAKLAVVCFKFCSTVRANGLKCRLMTMMDARLKGCPTLC